MKSQDESPPHSTQLVIFTSDPKRLHPGSTRIEWSAKERPNGIVSNDNMVWRFSSLLLAVWLCTLTYMRWGGIIAKFEACRLSGGSAMGPARRSSRPRNAQVPAKVFDSAAFLANSGIGRTLHGYKPKQIIFSLGDLPDAVFYVQKGRVRVSGLQVHRSLLRVVLHE
jgi:hypothetical protein